MLNRLAGIIVALLVLVSPSLAQTVPWVQSQYPATIAASGNLSGVIDMGGQRLFALIVPSGWTAANITFQSSTDGVNFLEAYDSSGAEITVTVGASPPYYIQFLNPVQFLGTRYLKLRSGTSAVPVTQVSAVTLTLTGQ